MIYVIDGLRFSNLDEFWQEIERVFADFISKIGTFRRTFSSLREVLSVFPNDTVVIWKNSKVSLKMLGHSETIKILERTLVNCHPSWVDLTRKELELAQRNLGETVFDTIVKIFVEQSVQLRLE